MSLWLTLMNEYGGRGNWGTPPNPRQGDPCTLSASAVPKILARHPILPTSHTHIFGNQPAGHGRVLGAFDYDAAVSEYGKLVVVRAQAHHVVVGEHFPRAAGPQALREAREVEGCARGGQA